MCVVRHVLFAERRFIVRRRDSRGRTAVPRQQQLLGLEGCSLSVAKLFSTCSLNASCGCAKSGRGQYWAMCVAMLVGVHVLNSAQELEKSADGAKIKAQVRAHADVG